MGFHIVGSLSACAVVVLFGAARCAAADLEQYRGFRLGSSAAAVVKAAGTTVPRHLETVAMPPARLQELEWRPPFNSERMGPRGDAVRRVVFTFFDDHLLKMVVEYDRGRTEGLTRIDMVAALSVAYGPHERVATRGGERSEYEALDTATVMARWRTVDTVVTLHRYDYIGGYALVITSLRLEQLARRAQAAEKVTAPARAAALLRVRADAAREALETTRSANKATFTP
jgi:hypothetical protein